MRTLRYIAPFVGIAALLIFGFSWERDARQNWVPSGPDAASTELEPTANELSDPTPISQRNAIPEDVLRGWLVDSSGAAIAGAQVVWVASITPMVADGFMDVPQLDDKPAVESVMVMSDGAGQFEFAEEPIGRASASCLWITKEGFMSRVVLLRGEASQWPNGKKVVLQHAQASRVSVVDGLGNPVASALVEVKGLRPEAGLKVMSEEGRAKECYNLRLKTNARGLVQVPDFGGPVWIQASSKGKLSKVWRREMPTELELILTDKFLVAGKVVVSGVSPEESSGYVRVEGQSGGLIVSTYHLRLGANLTWGQTSIPLRGEDSFLFTACGKGWRGERAILHAPEPGASHQVELKVEVGLNLWGVVLDQENGPIPGSRFSVTWSDEFGRSEVSSHSGADGWTIVRGCPSGVVVASASAPGFASSSFTWSMSSGPAEAITFNLLPGGVLAGRCTEGGVSAVNFELLVWDPKVNQGVVVRSVSDSEDGRFQVEGLPLGDVMVLALGAGGTSTSPMSIKIQKESPALVHLALQPNISVVGSVVVAADGGIPRGIEVQPLFRGTPIGRPIQGSSKGRFEGTAPNSAGTCSISVRATDCATQTFECLLSEEGTFNFRTVHLQPVGEVTFQLNAADDLRSEQCSFTCKSCDVPKRDFSADGLLRYESMSTGWHDVRLRLPDHTMADAFVKVHLGSSEAVQIDLSGTLEQTVQLSDVPEGMEEMLWLEMSPKLLAGEVKFSRKVAVNADGSAKVRWLESGMHVLNVLDSSGQTLRTRFVQVQPDQQNHLELSLEVAPIQLRILDQSGEPISGASVYTHHDNGFLAATYASDSSGLVGVFPADETPMLLCIQTQSGEVAWNIPLPPAPDDPTKPREVVLNCNASLRIELYDPSGPLAGKPCLIAGDPIEVEVSPTHTTDAQGRTDFNKLTPGSYLVRVYLPGHWPFNKLYEAKPDAPITRIKIPRLADLTVQVQDAAGQPLANQAITVWSLDYDKDIKRWWELGALDPSPATWNTDAQGRFTIPVLPEGPFRISCPGAETTIVLVPGADNLATLQVD